MTGKLFKVLLISHDQLAKGLLSSIEFFNKEVDNIAAVAAFCGDDDVKTIILNWLNSNADYDRLIITDIIGGSINQVAYRLLADFDFYLISGMNLPLLLEIIFLSELTEERLISAVNTAKDQIALMNNYVVEEKEDGF